MATVEVDISEGQITNAIAVALAESFSNDRRDAIIRDVVRAHLTHKENPYDKETLLSKTVGKVVREIAITQLTHIFQEAEEEIGKVVRETVGSQYIDNLCKKLRLHLTRQMTTNFSIVASLESDE